VTTSWRESESVTVRNVLERLGPPEEIVEAAEPAPAEPARCGGKLEVGALVALVVPLVGWLVGIVLVLVSRVWSNRDKAIAVALALIPAFLPLLLIAVDADSGGTQPVPPPGVDGGDVGGGAAETGALETTVFAVGILLAGLPSALFLWHRLRSLP
jgi:hypothetical protein